MKREIKRDNIYIYIIIREIEMKVLAVPTPGKLKWIEGKALGSGEDETM
jgi:hypothetical protein